MKKFFTLFVMLPVALSASAENYEPSAGDNEICIFYEANLNKDVPYVYVWNGDYNNVWHTQAMTPMGTNSAGNTIYKWTFTINPDNQWTPENIILTAKNSSGNVYDIFGVKDGNNISYPYINKAYYIDGKHEYTLGDEGYTVYFYDTDNWGNNLRLYTWHNQFDMNNGWPGVAMTSMGNNLYSYHIKGNNYSNIIFNNKYNNDNGVQTNNLTAVNDKLYTKDGAVVLSDVSNFPSALDGYKADARYTRERNGDNIWNTLCLPFAINTEDVENVTFYQLSSASSSQVTFSPISGEISGGTPVVYKQSEAGELVITADNVTLTNTISNQVPISNWTLKGTFEYSSDVDNIYFIYEDKFCNGDDITIRPYRAWFESTVGLGNAPIRIEVADTEGLQFIEQKDGTVKAYYDLQGRKLDSARKGLVIENGKIIMVK